MTSRRTRAAWLALLLCSTTPVVAAAQDASEPLLERASAARARGLETAPIFVYEFADFQCPHCARFALEVMPRIDSAFVKTGKVHWVFVNLPLPSHRNAWIAHEAAVCAGAVADRFWEMHDHIFAAQAEWSSAADPASIMARLARDAGVPADSFADCTARDRVSAVLLQDVIFAASSRVNGTPAFNVNNEHSVMGLKSFEEWKELLEKTIRSASGKK